VRGISPAGEGELQIAFDKLKQKLDAEGLFAEERKKPLPEMPVRIGIATAIDGAALQDLISVAKRRFPLVELVVAPCMVQGVGAAVSIVKALKMLDRAGVDVIILGRGGGSIEDLWAFNEEPVARQIAKLNTPLVTGIGHEVDFTIADFVADRRAPTPTAAMELLTPDKNAILEYLSDYAVGLNEQMKERIDEYRDRIGTFTSSTAVQMPLRNLLIRKMRVEQVKQKISESVKITILNLIHQVELMRSKLAAADVQTILKKGFVLVTQGGNFVKRGSDLMPRDTFSLRFFDDTIMIHDNEKENNI
jgi:exodeoxyribonuclease VII large subunit